MTPPAEAPPAIAAVEAGGTKVRVAVGRGPGGVRAECTIPTTSPDETLRAVIAFVRGTGITVAAAGVAAFGPIDLDPASPNHGRLLDTPKPGWAGADVAGALRSALGVPVAIETDVGAAALAERRWGAARDVADVVYVTVGTGIGAGVIIGGAVHHGMGHPEVGHIPVERQAGDAFAGVCPFHGGCLEGMASGPAIEARWGRPAAELADRPEVWDLEARYLVQGVRTVTYLVAPQRVLFGGGVTRQPGLVSSIARLLPEDLAGYAASDVPGRDPEKYVTAAALGQDAGLMGAFVLGLQAAGEG